MCYVFHPTTAKIIPISPSDFNNYVDTGAQVTVNMTPSELPCTDLISSILFYLACARKAKLDSDILSMKGSESSLRQQQLQWQINPLNKYYDRFFGVCLIWMTVGFLR